MSQIIMSTKMIKKMFFLSLFLINFDNIIFSMQSSDLDNSVPETENLTFLSLPAEIKHYIIEQLLDINKLNCILKKIKNAKNIFELYSSNLIQIQKELLNNLNNIRLTSKELKDFAQYYVNQLKSKEQTFIKEIKDQYPNYNQDILNNSLKDILDLNYNIDRKNLEEAARLIIAGANINLKNKHGETTLIWASKKGYTDIVELLLNHKYIKVNKQNLDGDNALNIAAIEKHKAIVELLLKRKDIDINIKDCFNQTPLMLAILRGDKDIAELLLNHKDIDINIKNSFGYTAYNWALLNNYLDIAKLISSKINQNLTQQ